MRALRSEQAGTIGDNLALRTTRAGLNIVAKHTG